MAERKYLDGCIGFILTLFLLGYSTIYSLVLVVFHLVLYKYAVRNPLLGKISFIASFFYLAILRVIHHFGLPELRFLSNVVQLIMTLRIVGLSHEIEDSIRNEKLMEKDKEYKDTTRRFIKVPDNSDAFNYFYNFIGLYTGPYFTYQMYSDTLSSPHLYEINVKPFLMEKASTLAWCLPSLIIVYIIAPVEFLRTEEVTSTPFLGLLCWMFLAFVYLRLRIYTAWMIAESICIISGVGLYPKKCNNIPCLGPKNFELYNDIKGNTNEEYDGVAISNLDIPNVEMSSGYRDGMRAWNRSVQFWLANFVYKRSPKSIRMPYTMFISAFWHGIHPGYFLSFMTIPLCTTAEDLIYKIVQINPETGERPKWFQFIWLNIRTRGFELMACGFLLLTWEDTVRLWNAVYWWLHIVMTCIIVASMMYLSINKNKQKKD
uniref:Lysophospholipid acyltransferase 7 n=1 Tax=Parastrongyloides trichosuri TaxID=131310 RepID=A0A0N4ZW08_PARTI